MMGHASAAMTLDVYAGLFADDLDTVAAQLDVLGRAAAEGNADSCGPSRRFQAGKYSS